MSFIHLEIPEFILALAIGYVLGVMQRFSNSDLDDGDDE